MKQSTRIIKKILDDFRCENIINETFQKKENSTFIILNFEFEKFYKYNLSVSDFFKKLTNNKNSLNGRFNNREWWSSLSIDSKNQGFYRYNITHNFVDIVILINSDKKMNELELKSRIKKIIPKFNIEITENNEFTFNQVFNDILSLESGFSLFGT